MATVTHIIRSHYDPADRDKLERETGQRIDNESDPWQTEFTLSAQRRVRATPTFVPASISYDEWGTPLQTAASVVPDPPPPPSSSPSSSTSTAAWYRCLTTSSSSSRAAPPRPSSAPTPDPSAQDARPAQPSPQETITKNNWFITRALRSAPPTKPSSPAPSLADLLARDPPPMPSEARYAPPVWLHIGPSNVGFGMLERRGWREGEGLGAHAVRARDAGKCASSSVKDTREVIDLTRSDSEASDSEDALENRAVIQPLVHTEARAGEASASQMQTSLLTPLPTVLKADRLGIGLKAKTEGPYKRSKKRVTHSAAALAAHVKSAEETRRKKAVFGKGKRGFAKLHKREEDGRKTMLAYLNE